MLRVKTARIITKRENVADGTQSACLISYLGTEIPFEITC